VDGVTGLLFDEYTPEGLIEAVKQAIARYRDPAIWRSLTHRAMGQRFGWEVSAKKYLEVYRRALAFRLGSR
jgi:starch synthase